MLPEVELAALADSIKAGGLRLPIVLAKDGSILDGRNRAEACRRAGVEPAMVTYDGDDFVGEVIRLNLQRRHLNTSQRAMIAARLATLGDGQRKDRVGSQICEPKTQAEAAALLSVSKRSVETARKAIETAPPEVIAAVDAGEVTITSAVAAAKAPDEKRAEVLGEQAKKKKKTDDADAGGGPPAHVAQATGENEWYTPPKILDAVRLAMGGIDLDPASCAKANETVRATRFYSIADDGLTQEWGGRVFLNPPYERGLIDRFIARVVDERRSNRSTAACVLVNNATESGWFQEMLWAGWSVCFIRGRVRFIDKGGAASGAPLQGQVLLYNGPDPQNFPHAVEALGPAYEASV